MVISNLLDPIHDKQTYQLCMKMIMGWTCCELWAVKSKLEAEI